MVNIKKIPESEFEWVQLTILDSFSDRNEHNGHAIITILNKMRKNGVFINNKTN